MRRLERVDDLSKLTNEDVLIRRAQRATRLAQRVEDVEDGDIEGVRREVQAKHWVRAEGNNFLKDRQALHCRLVLDRNTLDES